MTCKICGSRATHWPLDENAECVCCHGLKERGMDDKERIDFYFQLGRMLFHLPALFHGTAGDVRIAKGEEANR